MNENKNWYVIYTRQGKEKKIIETLNRKKIENYYPLNRIVSHSGLHNDWVYEPLLASCTFVRIAESEISHVKQIHGVINLLFWLGKPAIIDNLEIELIKKFISEYADVRLEKIRIKTNYTPVIPSMPDGIEREDYLFDVKNKTVKAILPSLGYSMVAPAEKAEMEIPAPPLFPRWSSSLQKNYRKSFPWALDPT